LFKRRKLAQVWDATCKPVVVKLSALPDWRGTSVLVGSPHLDCCLL
jgi:hypothetical protein